MPMRDATVRGQAGAARAMLDWLTNRYTTDPDLVPPTVGFTEAVPTAANLKDGYVTGTATAAAATLVTVPAGRTWKGEIGASCDVAVAGGTATAGQAAADFTLSGAGSTPPAGAVFGVEARCGANVATGTTGSQGNNSLRRPLTVIAPAGNDVLIQVALTIAGTNGRADAYATGRLL